MRFAGKVRAMRKHLLPLATLLSATALTAQAKAAVPSPPEIVNAAPKADWVAIAASDLMVMDLAPPDRGPGQASAKGKPRRVVIQLMPAPFSEGWVSNIRKLAAARFWDGLSINRVQDNYVVQWGDANGEDQAKARKLPEGLAVVPESEYAVQFGAMNKDLETQFGAQFAVQLRARLSAKADPYAQTNRTIEGWPVAIDYESGAFWPVHCYGMVGVGRDMPPNTGTGAELYTVIGHAPRHLDRNIALVGRVIEGIEHLSSLPRGTGALGFYETAEERTPIVAVRIGSEVSGLPAYEYLSTESASFARYADARANRRDAFFIRPAGGADVCNIPVPVRRVK
jgi:peptidylprolyl isomerase